MRLNLLRLSLKKPYIRLVLFLFPVAAPMLADDVTYSYDSAGNRIKREIVLKKTVSPTRGASDYASEFVDDREMRIYPNPTYGQLTVEIPGFTIGDECELLVVSLSGEIILSRKAGAPTETLDISGQKNGVYILHISFNGKESTWKILKQ